jgi:hypothetical protein
MNRQIFFDPQRKRWKRLRRILDAVALFSTVILVLFFLNVVKNQHLPELLLPTPNGITGPFRNKPPRRSRPSTSRGRGARPAASLQKFLSIPAKTCAPLTTSMTTRPASPR